MTNALVPVVETPAVDAAAAAQATSGVVPAGSAALALPRVIVEAGPVAVGQFVEFFAGRIANERTRAAYARAAGQFLGRCESRGLRLEAISPLHVAAYIRMHPGSAPTVKQHLAGIRMLGDWLVVSQVLPVNPAAAVRGPKHVVTKGATPVLSPAEARKLLECIDTGALAGLRDRALLSVMLYSFARVSAVLGMRRQDYFGQRSRGWLRLHEKGRKRHDVPAHHRAAAALDQYVAAAELEEPKVPLFQSADPAGRRLTGRLLQRRVVLAMIKRRASAAGLPSSTCCHTFRATGITAYLSNGGTPARRRVSIMSNLPSRTREASPRAKSPRASETWSHDDVASGSIRPHRELPPSLAERRPRDRVAGEDRVPTSLRWVPLPVVDHAARESAGRQRSSASSARTSGVEVSEQAVGRASVLRRAFVGAARQPQAPGLRRVAP